MGRHFQGALERGGIHGAFEETAAHPPPADNVFQFQLPQTS